MFLLRQSDKESHKELHKLYCMLYRKIMQFCISCNVNLVFDLEVIEELHADETGHVNVPLYSEMIYLGLYSRVRSPPRRRWRFYWEPPEERQWE